MPFHLVYEDLIRNLRASRNDGSCALRRRCHCQSSVRPNSLWPTANDGISGMPPSWGTSGSVVSPDLAAHAQGQVQEPMAVETARLESEASVSNVGDSADDAPFRVSSFAVWLSQDKLRLCARSCVTS